MAEGAGEIGSGGEDVYKVLVENVSDLIFLIDENLKVVSLNPAAAGIFGKRPEELVGKSVEELFPKEVAEGYVRSLKSVFATGCGVTADSVRVVGGRTSHLSSVLSPVKDASGRVVRVIGVSRDVSVQKTVELALEESEERLKLLFEYAPDAYYLSDREGNFLDGNRAAEEMVGYAREEMIGKNLLKVNLLAPEHLTNAVKLVAKSILGQSTGPDELVLVRKDGSKVTVEIRTFPLKIAGKLTILGIARDVTDRIETEQTVRKLYKALDNTPDAVILADLAGKIQYANPALLRVGRFKDINEAVGTSVFDYADEAGAKLMREHVLPQLMSKGSWEGELVLKTKGGIAYPAAVVCSIVCDESGRPTNMLAIFRDVTERKAYEVALAYSEKRFRDVVTVTTEYVWEMDVNGVSGYFSPGIEKILGYKPEEVIGKDIYFLWDPAERERQATEALEILKTCKPFKGFINVNLHKDGHKVILETSGVPMFDEGGKLIGYRGADRDVTERKAAEKAIQESEEQYRAMFESANDIIVTLDLGGRISSINRKIENITGYRREDIVGKHISELRMFPLDSIKAMLASFSQRAQGSSVPPYVVETIGSGGRQIFAEITGSSLMQDGKAVGLIVFIKDITDRRLAESALLESEEQHRLLFENAGVGIGYYTPDGIILGFNKLAVQHLGGRPEDYIGKSLVDVFGKEQGSMYMLRLNEAANSPGALEFEDKVSLPTGMKWFSSTYTRVCGGDGKVKTIQIVSQDITDRRQASEGLKQASDEWQKTFDSITDLIFIIDGDFRIIKVNAAFCAYMKAKPEDLIGKRCYEVMHKSDRPWPNCPQVKSIQDKTPHSEEVLDKEVGIPLLVSVSPIFDERGEVAGAVHVATDITERKMSEDELRVSEAKYRNIFENAIEGIFQSTPEGKYLNVNPAFAHMFGFESPQEMISSVSNISTLYVYPSERAKVKELLAIDGFVKDYEAEMYHTDGRRIWGSINAKAIKDKDSRILYYEGTTEDITNRKLDEERMRHINRQLMGIIDFLPDATFVVDKESKVFAWNRAMEELTGLSPEVAIGKGNDVYSKIFYGLQRPILIDSVFQTDSKILEKYSYVERRGYAVYAESFAPMLRKGAGAYLWIVASPLFDEQGNLIGAIETIRDITEKKKVDEEIRKLSKAVESSPNAVIVTDLSGRIEYVNDALPKVGRFSDKHEAIGRSVFEFAAGTEVDRLKNEIIPIILSKGQWSGEMLLSKSDHSTYFADMVCSAIPDERGRPKYLFATFHDISDRKNAEEKLKVTQRQQKALLDNIPDLVWLKDVERRFIAVNDAYGRMLNMKSEELVGKTELDVWPKALAEKYMADDAEVMSFGRRKSTEESVVDRHGRSRWMETIKTPIFDEGGSVVGTAGISRDTTERRNMEEELQEVNRRLNDTIEFFPDATFVIDREGKVLAWNRAIEEMTGVRKEEMVGKGDFTYAMPFYGERRPILLDLVLKSDAGVRDKYTSLTKTGDIIQAEAFATKLFGGVGAYVSITASPLKDEHGEVVGAIEAIRDITEKKKAAEELKAKVDDLERFNKLMVGRELKMIELKREINSILDRLGEPPRYSVPVSEIKKLIAEEKDAGQKNGDGK